MTTVLADHRLRLGTCACVRSFLNSGQNRARENMGVASLSLRTRLRSGVCHHASVAMEDVR